MNGIHRCRRHAWLGSGRSRAERAGVSRAVGRTMHGIAVTCQISGVNSTPEQRATIEKMPANYTSKPATTKNGSMHTRRSSHPRASLRRKR